MTATLADRLEAAGGRPSGFDYLRLILAVAVVSHHSIATSYGAQANAANWIGPWGPVTRAILPMFFALSGFLVAGSMLRSKTLLKFLGLRLIRIYPALAVEVLLSAFLIGAVATTLPLLTYFTDPEFLRYLINVTGHISYELPGVFAGNPKPDVVNQQLWTVPFELICYIVLGGLFLLGAKQHRAIVPLGTVIVLGLILTQAGVKSDWAFPAERTMLSGPLLVVCFLSGVSIYLYRDHVVWSPVSAGAAAAVSLALFAFIPHANYFVAPLLTYVTVVWGLTNCPRIRLIRGADFSYGIFLYGYVIQQFVMWALPAAREWWWNVLICLPATAIFAAMSWYWVERPALRLRHPLGRLEDMYLSMRTALLVKLQSARTEERR